MGDDIDRADLRDRFEVDGEDTPQGIGSDAKRQPAAGIVVTSIMTSIIGRSLNNSTLPLSNPRRHNRINKGAFA